MLQGQLIKMSDLPSKGKTYPTDIEIYVKPMTLKEEVSSSIGRFEVSRAGYYDGLLESIMINGRFDKNQLLFADIQMIDLVRRLYTFELESPISIDGIKCEHCNEPLKTHFMLHEVEFTDFEDEIFGKEFTFSDGISVKVSPITVENFVKISRKYLTNAKMINGVPDISNYVIAYYAASITEISSEKQLRVFESNDALFRFAFEYLSGLYLNKDRKVLDIMDKELTSTVIPFKVECSKCQETAEVYIDASMRFCQE